MKTIIKYTSMAILTALLGAGCSSSGGSSGSSDSSGGTSTTVTTVMVVGTTYTVSTGDKIVPTNEANVTVEHNLAAGTKTIKLLSGSATLYEG